MRRDPPVTRQVVSDEAAARFKLYGAYARFTMGGPYVTNVRPVDALEIAWRAAA